MTTPRPTILCVTGGWQGHQPDECADLVGARLTDHGVDVIRADSLDALDDAAAHRAVVLCWTLGELDDERTHRLAEAVAAGTGLAGWHGGLGDAFRASTEFQFMVGGQFVAHPGDFTDHRVEITVPDHPITAGLSDFTLESEQYYMHVDPSNTVLAETTFSGAVHPWIDGCCMPVVWTRQWGEGRVFYSSIGHGPEELMIPEVAELTQRGVLWSAGLLDGDAELLDDTSTATGAGA